MQETVAKMINYAVSSFPKQSLDEWILDYPQQVIITTIHLILSHEINELLEELTAAGKRSDKDDMSDANEDEEDSDEDEEDEAVSNGNQSKPNAKSRRSNLSSAGHGTFSKKSSKKNIDEEED